MGAFARGGSKPGPALSARYAGRGRWRAANRNVGHHTRLCRLGPAELSGQALDDPAILSLSQRLEMVEDPALSDRFPGRRLARVQVDTRGGHLFDSGEVEATWKADSPPTDAELRQKFRWLARTVLSKERAVELEEVVWGCAGLPDAATLLTLLAPTPENVKRENDLSFPAD